MNKVNEIVDGRILPIGWKLVIPAAICGALFVAQFLVPGQVRNSHKFEVRDFWRSGC